MLFLKFRNGALYQMLRLIISTLCTFALLPIFAHTEPTISSEKILAKYPFLKEGKKPDFFPELIVSNQSLLDSIQKLYTADSVIIADDFNMPRLQSFPNVIHVKTNSIDEVVKVLKDPLFIRAKKVIGVGGSGSNDVAKSVAVEKEQLISVITILSTNCISTNRSVIGEGLDAISYRAATPVQTIVCLADISQQDDETKVFWTQSGLGDYLSAISAAIDQGYSNNCLDKDILYTYLPEAFANLDWIATSFVDYDSESLRKIAQILHESSLFDIINNTNLNRIGGEHAFYRLVIEQNPHLRFKNASHGHIVALGTLINAKIATKVTGDESIYKKLLTAFLKIKMPFTSEKLSKLGMTKEVITRAVKELNKGSTRSSLMIDYFKQNSVAIIDDLFDELDQTF